MRKKSFNVLKDVLEDRILYFRRQHEEHKTILTKDYLAALNSASKLPLDIRYDYITRINCAYHNIREDELHKLKNDRRTV